MPDQSKIASIDIIKQRVRQAHADGRTVVMCHGCFDIVHPGHIRHLQEAARYGDRLLVTVTGDAMVGKGNGRPLIPEDLRAENLAALDCVDWVCLSPHRTAAELLEQLKPNVYVKGREYEQNNDQRFLDEQAIVNRNGGRVVFTSGDVVFSSTALISEMHRTMLPHQQVLDQMQSKHGLTAAGIGQLIEDMQGKSVLVIGEVIFDTYVFCDQPNVAGEGPMLSLRPLEYRSFDGGAAIIARHLAAMGARPILLTALPETPQVESFLHRMALDGIIVRHIPSARNVMEKQRFLVGTNKVMKLDIGDPMVLDDQQRRALLDQARQCAAETQGLMLADYGLGLLTPVIIRQISAALRPHVDLMVGDVSARRSSLLAMQEMDVILPTELELRQSINEFDEGLTSVVWNVLERTHSVSAIVTLGDGGLIAFDRRQDTVRDDDHFSSRLHAEPIPALTTHAIDQLGCGDALSAATLLTLLAGGTLPAAAFIGSMAGAAQAQQMGNVPIGSRELRQVAERVLDASLAWRPQSISVVRGEPSDQLPVSNP